MYVFVIPTWMLAGGGLIEKVQEGVVDCVEEELRAPAVWLAGIGHRKGT